MWFAAGVDVHEGARSHGDLHVSGVEAALSKHRRLLVRHLRRDAATAIFRDHRVPNKNVLQFLFYFFGDAGKENSLQTESSQRLSEGS